MFGRFFNDDTLISYINIGEDAEFGIPYAISFSARELACSSIKFSFSLSAS